MQFLRNPLPDFKNYRSSLILALLRIERYTVYPPHLNYTTANQWLWKSQFSRGIFFHVPAKFAKKVFLPMKKNFFWTLLLAIRMIVFGLLARKKRCRQKLPGGRKSEICQTRHGLCWCVLWRKSKTAFHSRHGKSNRQTLLWNSLFCHLPSSRTERLLTRQSWLKTGLPQLQGLRRKRRMVTELVRHQPSWLSYPWSYASTLQDISTQAKYHRRAEESLAVHIWDDLPQKSTNKAILSFVKKPSLCESWRRTLNTSWDHVFAKFRTASKGCFLLTLWQPLWWKLWLL